MSLLLLFSRRRATTNTGHAEILVTEALGSGFIVVEELSGHAEIPAPECSGSGRVIQPQPQPDQNLTAGPILLPRRNFGRGRAVLPALSARGSGRLVYRTITGSGRAGLSGLQVLGRGRLILPTLRGAGAAAMEPPDALGFGLLRLPERPQAPAPPPGRLAFQQPWEADYEPQAAAPARRRPKAKASGLDEDEELLLLMETLK